MFPSGKWTGHYDQCGVREVMEDLHFVFDGMELRGRGSDRVGPFQFTGQVLAGHRVQMMKKYENLHHVAYLGEHDGEGTISGTWSLWSDHGTFAIRPMGGFRKNSAEIKEWTF